MNRSTISSHRVDLTKEHLDIFLETETHLETYETSSEKMDELLIRKKILCSKKNPHRKVYLDYEGYLSQDRGFVKILWKGFYITKMNVFPNEIKMSLVDNQNLVLEF